MPILATNIQKARHPMPPVTISIEVDGEERTEVLRFTRCTRSPATRSQFQEVFAATAPEKEEIIRVLMVCDVQSLDIVDAESKPFPLGADYLNTVDDTLLLAIWESLQESLSPKAKTSTSTSSG
jgi:hypothetical protein